MIIPIIVNNLITELEEHGYMAYAVGGCVRDSLLGLEPKDWDICTSALPEQIKAVFNSDRVLEMGIKHGTVTVIRGGTPYEITTFRIDGEYHDCRHPDRVEFTGDVALDLARRDFTINAMAYNPREGLVDPFGGQRDIKNGIIRAVGEAELRFSEDALRILRALRFSISLGFEIEKATAAAMIEKRALLKNISAERIRAELTAALLCGSVKAQFMKFRELIAEIIPELRPCFDFQQHTRHHCFDVYEHILTAVDNYSGGELAVKLALLMHDAGKPKMCRFYDSGAHFKGHPAAGVKIAAEVYRRLKLDNKTTTVALTLIRFHDVRLTGGMAQILKLASLIGDENMPRLFAVMRADALAQSDYMRAEKLALIDRGEANFRLAQEKNMCRSLKALKIDGRDVKALGFCGRGIGAALHYALNGVMNGSVENESGRLKEYVSGFRLNICK